MLGSCSIMLMSKRGGTLLYDNQYNHLIKKIMKKETFRILFFINKNRLKINGLATIMVRVTVNGNSVQFSSKLDVDPIIWDQKTQKTIEKPYIHINQEIAAMRNKIQKVYSDLSARLQYVSAIKVKESYLSCNQEMYITYQFKQQINIFRTSDGRLISSVTRKIYERTLNRLLYFLKKEYRKIDILIQEIDYDFLEKFYSFLRTEYTISHNSASKYMKRFAAIMNYAYKVKILQVNPFDLYTFREEKIYKPCLTQSEIDTIAKKTFCTSRLDRIRDIFVFCCFTGLSFSDIFEIKFSYIEERSNKYWLIFPRVKTHIISTIPLLDSPIEIIKKYYPDFPNVKNQNITIFEKLTNQKTNEYLKEIAEVCGITKNLTFHVARKSFATIALDNGVSIESISKMLGHSSIRTTERYITITTAKIEREMNLLQEKLNKREERRNQKKEK